MVIKTVGLMVNSYKGFKFLEQVIDDERVKWVCSYKAKGLFDAYSEIKSLCLEHKVKFVEYENVDYDADKVFLVGWQYMINDVTDNCVVLHDSVLPFYRGFCPTVTAMLDRASLGVTALIPSGSMDSGKILTQHWINKFNKNDTIKDVYDNLALAYRDCFYEVIANNSHLFYDNDNSSATYSLWRDKEDYYVNWNQTCEEIVRFFKAVGFPYDGAMTRFNGEDYKILDAWMCDPVKFVNPTYGKVFKKDGCKIEVVCKDGLVRMLLNKELPRTRCRLI